MHSAFRLTPLAFKHVFGRGGDDMDGAANLVPLLSISAALDLVQLLLERATSLYRLSHSDTFRQVRKGELQ